MIGDFQDRFGSHFGILEIRFRGNEIGWGLSRFQKVVRHVVFIVPQSYLEVGQ